MCTELSPAYFQRIGKSMCVRAVYLSEHPPPPSHRVNPNPPQRRHTKCRAGQYRPRSRYRVMQTRQSLYLLFTLPFSMKEPHGFPSSALDDELADVRGVVVGDLPPPRCARNWRSLKQRQHLQQTNHPRPAVNERHGRPSRPWIRCLPMFVGSSVSLRAIGDRYSNGDV